MQQHPESTPTKGERSRALILEAATGLIAERGFGDITLQNILDRAKVTKGKFFHHFVSKEALFTQLLKNAFQRRNKVSYEEIEQGSKKVRSFEKLLELLDVAINWHREGLPETVRLMVFATMYFAPRSKEMIEVRKALERNSSVTERLVRKAITEGDLPDQLSPRTVALLFPSVAVGGNTVGFLADEKTQTARNLEELRTMLLLLHEAERRRNA